MALGEQLRKARLERNLRPSEVAAATRMKVQIVEALEQEDFSKMAAPIYGKGFIRMYAEHVGLDPNTDYLEGAVPLDEQRQVGVNRWMETEIPGIFAAGDIRSGSPRQVSTAAGDGAIAAIAAQRFLQKLKQ